VISHTEIEREMDSLYDAQNAKFRDGFTGKEDRIARQYEEFWHQSSAVVDVDAYLVGDLEHKYTKLPKWVQTKTPFTGISRETFRGSVLADSPTVVIIGCMNSFDVAQYKGEPGKATMSMVHVLAIPKAGFYNGVSLTKGNVGIIEDMVMFFRRCWRDSNFQEAVLQHQLDAIDKRNKEYSDEEAHALALAHWNELKSLIGILEDEDFGFGLHLYPDHSVSHLHMHIIAMPKWCRWYSTSEHDEKTVDALELREWIRRRPNEV